MKKSPKQRPRRKSCLKSNDFRDRLDKTCSNQTLRKAESLNIRASNHATHQDPEVTHPKNAKKGSRHSSKRLGCSESKLKSNGQTRSTGKSMLWTDPWLCFGSHSFLREKKVIFTRGYNAGLKRDCHPVRIVPTGSNENLLSQFRRSSSSSSRQHRWQWAAFYLGAVEISTCNRGEGIIELTGTGTTSTDDTAP